MSAWKHWERRCANELSEATGEPVERVGYQQSAATGSHECDLRTPLPLAVECRTGKGTAGVNLQRAVADAVEAAGDGEIPVAAVQRRHGRGQPQDRWAVLRWEDFLELVADLS